MKGILVVVNVCCLFMYRFNSESGNDNKTKVLFSKNNIEIVDQMVNRLEKFENGRPCYTALRYPER